jgi:hypothetical protein
MAFSPGLDGRMDRKTALQWVCPSARVGGRHGPSTSAPWPSRGEALTLVLLLSLGLWALIWGAVSLGADGLR